MELSRHCYLIPEALKTGTAKMMLRCSKNAAGRASGDIGQRNSVIESSKSLP
jgi:hypothetical protein